MSLQKYAVKEIGKPFKVQVSARKYTGWTKSSYFAHMGGLYGLAIGADKMKTITIKVILNNYLNYGAQKDLEAYLERKGFESRWRPRARFPWSGNIWVNEEVIKFTSSDPAGLKEEAKQYVAEKKAQVKKALQEVLNNFLEDRGDLYDNTIWDPLHVEVAA